MILSNKRRVVGHVGVAIVLRHDKAELQNCPKTNIKFKDLRKIFYYLFFGQQYDFKS